MKLDIQGNSGCFIDVIQEDNHAYINKYTNDENYASRLVAQGVKQQDAYNTINSENIKVPFVYNITENEDSVKAVIKMKYIYSKNFITFFELSDVNEIKHFAESICNFVNDEITNCEVKDVDYTIITNKVDSVIANAKKNQFVSTNIDFIMLLDKIKKHIDAECEYHNGVIRIPIGKCHGDLTLSNILFNSGDYYLIDFLDSFIDTPLQDICKLRQDTQYKWSTLMYNSKYDKRKIDIIYKYIDDYICKYFSKYKFYTEYYFTLQLVNILRIVPYAKSQEVADYLYNILKDFVQ